MDRVRGAVFAAAIVSSAASLFAVGTAMTSSADDSSAPTETAVAATEGSTATSEATATADIEISNFKFTPPELNVAPGTAVVFTNNDSTDHLIVFDGQAFPSSPTLGEGDAYRVVLTEPGTYPYSCGIHPTMTGTITVEG